MNRKLNYQKPSLSTIEVETNVLCNSNYDRTEYRTKRLNAKCRKCDAYVNICDTYCSNCGEYLEW